MIMRYEIPKNQYDLARGVVRRMARNMHGRKIEEGCYTGLLIKSEGSFSVAVYESVHSPPNRAVVSIISFAGEKGPRRVKNALKKGGVNIEEAIVELL